MERSSTRDLVRLASVSVLLLIAGGLPARAAVHSRPIATRSARNRKSAPLRDFRYERPSVPAPEHEIENAEIPRKLGSAPGGDRVVQRRAAPGSLQALTQFEGGSDADNDTIGAGRVAPPDPTGDVGPNHYVQFVNLFFTVYDRSGAPVLGPLPGNAFWAGLGTACETSNDGDPIVQYDQLADRWMVAQFALPNFPDGPFHQCVAVSATPDPTGEYYQYDFVFDDTIMNDYPKLAVWPDAYYMTANEYQSPDFDFVGTAALAFDRTAMLGGGPATMIRIDIPEEGGVLPSDLEGATPPPAGSPNFLLTFDTDPPRLTEWRFHADFANTDASSLDGPIDVPISAFDVPVCDAVREACVPQLGSPELLEVLGGRVMYRLGYRRFADHESLLTNFTVNAAAPASQAAIRWCELRDPNGTPTLQQEGTFAPDGEHRWMGSIAMDAVGNVALGYNKSGGDMYPSLAVTGRLVGDPAGTLSAESVFLAGGGSQVDSNSRWGDYSTMSVDPTDDCTFWFTGEYYAATGSYDWHTRVATFRFPSCTTGPTGVVEGTVTDGAGPISGATVTAGDSVTVTDAAGHYSLRLPAGTYDMTASDFGHVGGAASGVAVTDGGDTVQNFTLPAAASHLVVGVVSDASGGGWPLYARIDVSADGFPGATLFTDPVSGYYEISLAGAAVYHFRVTAVANGYTALLQDVSLAAAPAGGGGSVVRNFGLSADLQACSAPGYAGALTQDFASGAMPSGWTTRSTEGADWEVTSGPDPCGEWDANLTGGAGAFGIVQTSCEHILADAQLRTPVINLAGATSPRIEWHNDYFDLGSIADVDVSIDAGATWTNVWRRAGVDERGPGLQSVDISDLAAGQPAVEARFHYTAFFGWWWQIDDVFIGDPGATCHSVPGGLVVGRVRDANTGAGIVGAAVAALPNDALARTVAGTGDPNVGDGFYTIFGGSGSRTLEASMARYGAQDLGVTVIPGGTVRLDFELAAGRLAASPSPFAVRILPGQSMQQTLTLSNAGARAAGFEISEIDVPLSDSPSRPVRFASEAERVRALSRLVPPNHGSGARRFGEKSAKGLPPLPDGPAASLPTLPAGRILATFASQVAYAWGIAYDTEANDYWLTNMLQSGGDDRIYRFLPDGTPTGDSIDEHPAITGVFAADGTYNPRTHTIWQVDAVPLGSSCIFEADPATKTLTGRTICPVTGTSERGLAYDAASDTYYIGSWNDGTLKHFDANGTVLDSKFVGLNIAGLAFNATTSHLFVLTDLPDLGHDVFVFDTAHDYAPVGAFPVTDDSGAHVLQNGAGLEADCDGNLWIVDQSPQLVYKVVSGERGFCPVDIPWLALNPASGTVPGGAGGSSALPVTVGLDATGLFAGLHRAQLRIGTDTPYAVPPIGVELTVAFLDVPQNVPPGAYPFESYVYGAAGAGIMPGCDQNGFLFCPNDGTSGAAGLVIRADMAAYVWKAVHGPFAPPPVYTGIFTDVNPFDRNADYIQGVYDDGITAGCQAPGQPMRFCPGQNISRGQMAVFIEKGLRGADYVPAPCQGIFSDVPCPPDGSDPFGDWIELLFHDGVTAGCNAAGAPPAYCPARSIPNDQMAVFLVKAFQIPF